MDSERNRPCCAGIRVGDKVTIYDLFRANLKIPYLTCKKNLNSIRDFIVTASNKKHHVITTDFKDLIEIYDFPVDYRNYNIYDLHLDRQLQQVYSTGNQSKDHEIVRRVLDRMSRSKLSGYQTIISNAAVVYYDLERRGLVVNDTKFNPSWSMKTYSGRSKTTGFNIQGHFGHDKVLTEGLMVNSVLVHFDWIAADIRVASLFSKDERLINSFEASDPYSYMMELINRNNDQHITREECKLSLLKAVNSMDTSSVVLRKIYPDLGNWIEKCKSILSSNEGHLSTILGRQFKISQAKNSLAVLNGAMQGSVAHAMQLVIRKVWERLSHYLVAEIHDSLVMCVPADNNIIKSVVNIVSEIMTQPFLGILDDNPIFPVKVSIGKKWKSWKLYETRRSKGVERARKEDQTAT